MRSKKCKRNGGKIMMTKTEFFDMSTQEMRHEIAETEVRLKILTANLERAYLECARKSHRWGPVQYTPIEHKGYQTQGDPPGTMGVDWQGPMWVDASTTKQWTRVCARCGKTETTRSTRKERIAGSIPGTSAEGDVPDFDDRMNR